MSLETVSGFVARQRAERIAANKPRCIADAQVYHLLDGLLARRREVADDEAA